MGNLSTWAASCPKIAVPQQFLRLHMPLSRFFYLLLLVTSLINCPPLAALELKGSYTNYLILSQTAAKEDYSWDRNRLRIDLYQRHNSWDYHLVLDNDLSFGNYLRSTEFSNLQNYSEHSSEADWSESLHYDRNYWWHTSIYRCYLRYRHQAFDFAVGRQRTSWGTSRFWSPTDIINPHNPMSIEPGNRAGSDTIKLNAYLESSASLTLLHVPKRWEESVKTAARWQSQLGNYDYSTMVATIGDTDIVGFDFTGYLGKWGVSGEGASLEGPGLNRSYKLTIGGEYAFGSSSYFYGEYFHNSSGSKSSNHNIVTQIISNPEIPTFWGQDYLGTQLGYSINALSSLKIGMISNLHDRSYYLAPSYTYSLRDDMEFAAGLATYTGPRGSEMNITGRDTYYLHYGYYF